MRNFIKIPFLLFFIFYFSFSLSSCSIKSEEKKVEAQKQVLTEHLQEKVQEQKEKFDKSKSREKVEGFTGFLCSPETLTHTGTNLKIDVKNCLGERNDESINFTLDGNTVIKNINGSEKLEVIKIYQNNEKITAAKFIKEYIIKNFPNNLERIYCNPLSNKKIKLENKDFSYIYDISPYGLYRQESNEQIEKNPSTKICNGFYNPNKGVILATQKGDLIVEVIKSDDLIKLNNIKIKGK